MSKKYYAVVIGKIPGIYHTWKECQAQTNGFSGAKYKGFSSQIEAHEFIEQNKAKNLLVDTIKLVTVPIVKDYTIYDRTLLDIYNDKQLLLIYVDGSKYDTPNGIHKGSGAYCRFNKKNYFMTVLFDQSICHKYNIVDLDDITGMSSPSFEFLACVEVLYRLINFKVKEINGIAIPLNQPYDIVFVCDYNGVKNFIDGSWTPKEDYIKKITAAAHKIINFIGLKGIRIHVKHCNGHIGVLGNEMSDIAAKSRINKDEITNLVDDLSTFLKERD